MFIGHFAVGFASKPVAPRTPLPWLMAAPLFLDLLWPIFLLAGIESVKIVPGITAFTPLDLHDYPYTHSLLMAVVWSVLYGGVVFARYRDRLGALVCAAGVFSHWILDFITHRPDMPLYPGSTTYLGLGLWNSIAGTLIVESLIFVGAVAFFARRVRPLARRGAISLWSFVLLLVALYVANAVSPPPPNETALAYGALLGWIAVPWAIWIERTRKPVGTAEVAK